MAVEQGSAPGPWFLVGEDLVPPGNQLQDAHITGRVTQVLRSSLKVAWTSGEDSRREREP